MADTDVHSDHEVVSPGESYKAKLLQPSNKDELSVPHEPEVPVLPPTKDAGSPPMIVSEAPAGADEVVDDKASPTEGASSTDTYTNPTNKTTGESANKGASDDSAASGRTATAAAADDTTTSGSAAGSAPLPEPTADGSLPGAELSDVEKEAISDPSTAELVAAATGDSAAAVANEEPAPANVITVEADESSDVTKIQSDITTVLPGPGSKAGTPVVTAAAAADGGSGDSSTVEAERELPHAMSVLTASDAAAAGLANLESQLDAGRSYSRLDSNSSSRSGSGMSRGSSVMSRTETGNVIDFTSPTAARDTMPEKLLESSEDEGGAAAPAADAAVVTKPAGVGVAATYGHLQQAPAAEGDAAAEPAAAAALPSSVDETSISGGRMGDCGDVINNSGDVAAAAVPEPAVGVDKEGTLISDDAAAVGSGSSIVDVLGESAADATADDDGDQNPLAAAAAAVAKPVAAAMTNLKDVLLGPDITLGESENDTGKE